MTWAWAAAGGLLLLLVVPRRQKESKHPPPPAGVSKSLESAAKTTGVPLHILVGVAHTESRYNTRAVSRAGAQGLMQLMPQVSAAMGVDPFNPWEAAHAGARILKRYYNKYGSWKKALAAYNWGPGNVNKGGPWPSSVHQYIKNVLA